MDLFDGDLPSWRLDRADLPGWIRLGYPVIWELANGDRYRARIITGPFRFQPSQPWMVNLVAFKTTQPDRPLGGETETVPCGPIPVDHLRSPDLFGLYPSISSIGDQPCPN